MARRRSLTRMPLAMKATVSSSSKAFDGAGYAKYSQTHLFLEPARRGLHHPLDPPRLDLLEAVGVVDADRRARARRADSHELLDGALLAHAHVTPDVARAAAETGAGEEVSGVLFVPDDHGDPPRRCCSTGAWARGIWKMLLCHAKPARRSAIEWHA